MECTPEMLAFIQQFASNNNVNIETMPTQNQVHEPEEKLSQNNTVTPCEEDVFDEEHFVELVKKYECIYGK